MSRLIDIDELKGCVIIRPTTHEEIEHIRACKNLISHDDIPTAMERSTAYYNDGWIPVSERLPEVEADVLLTLRGLTIHTGFRANTEGYFYVDGGEYVEFEDVIAWRELPAPYQPKGE